MSDVVLVAAGGGHLEQLKLLSERLPYSGPRRWITFDTPQTRSLLADETVSYVPEVGPRDWLGLIKNFPKSGLIGTKETTEAVISTGSGMALAYLPRSGALGIPTHYIESATRVTGPSLTGQILSLLPGIKAHSQYKTWANGRWNYSGSVFEGFEVVDEPIERDESCLKKVVVSLGTIRGYGFRRLVERLIDLLGPDIDITWQTGSTNTDGLPIEASNQLPRHELLHRIREADVLIAHAGTGISLLALNEGLCPVLVPREASHGEHVDDHQAQIAKLLDESGLAVVRAVEELTFDDLTLAWSKSVRKGLHQSTLVLD